MQGVIVCLFDRLVVCTVDPAPTFGSRFRIIGTIAYRKDILDQYIARLFIATDGIEPIHVFNAYHDDEQNVPCQWATTLFERLHVFSSAEIIQPPNFHGQSEWITALPGLVQRLTHFEWPATAAIRDRGVDVLLSRAEGSSEYTVNTIQLASDISDQELVHPRSDQRALLQTALDSVYNQITNNANTLDLPLPTNLTPNLLSIWCDEQVDPFTCAECIRAICDECPAFSDEHLSPLLSLTPQSDIPTSQELAAIIRLDNSSDRGVGITIDSPDTNVFVISYSGIEVGELLISAIEKVLAHQPTAPAPAPAEYQLNITQLQ